MQIRDQARMWREANLDATIVVSSAGTSANAGGGSYLVEENLVDTDELGTTVEVAPAKLPFRAVD